MKSLGQYFTKHELLKNKVVEFMQMSMPGKILEPSVGRGDLVDAICKAREAVEFDLYEIDATIKPLEAIRNFHINYCDFLTADITSKYSTIVGNPPYVKTTRGNLYVDFIEKCFHLLQDNGEMIFIVPSDFFKLTCACKIISNMMAVGRFTHIFHPNNEKLFENATIDVMIFRYSKVKGNPMVLYNDEIRTLNHSNGLITFHQASTAVPSSRTFRMYFNIIVGMVRGKESVYKNKSIGNISVLNGKDQNETYVFVESFPSECQKINKHLEFHKSQLLERQIRKFNETNWFEWGAPRNIQTIRSNWGMPCIYIHTLTRKSEVAFVGNLGYFGGGLICLIPSVGSMDLQKIANYLNTDDFKSNFMYSGRFKIGQRHLCYSQIPTHVCPE